MVENVECFGAKLGMQPVSDREALEDACVEVRDIRTEERVTPRITEGQTGRRVVRCGIEEERSKDPWFIFGPANVRPANTGHEVHIGAGAFAVRDARVVIVGAIVDAEWPAGLESGDAGPLPSAQSELFPMAASGEFRQGVDVADGSSWRDWP